LGDAGLSSADVLGVAVCGARPGRFPAAEAVGAAKVGSGLGVFGAKCGEFGFDRFAF